MYKLEGDVDQVLRTIDGPTWQQHTRERGPERAASSSGSQFSCISEFTMGDQKAMPQILQNKYTWVVRFLHDLITKMIIKELMHP